MSHIVSSTLFCVERFVSHLWVTHVTHLNELCPTYKWVMHINESYCIKQTFLCRSTCVTCVNDSCPTCKWLTPVTYINESCPIYESVMSHVRTSHITHIKEACPTHNRVMSHTRMSHVTESRHTRFLYQVTWQSKRVRTSTAGNQVLSLLPHTSHQQPPPYPPQEG